MAPPFLTSFALLIITVSSIAYATDPNQLEDFCVATNDPNNAVFGVQGKMCKKPSEVTADDFLYRGINEGTDTSNPMGANYIILDETYLPGLNTLGISIARADLAEGGRIPPHFHPRATEVIVVVEGHLDIGLISFNRSDNSAKLFSKALHPGDVFVLPQGLIHYVYNAGDTNGVVLAAMSSQNPGMVDVPIALFGTQPPIPVDLLSKSFKLDAAVVQDLQSKF